jgi:hypothetical protein
LAEIGEAAALERARIFRPDIDRRAIVTNSALTVALAEIDSPAVEIGDGRLRIERDCPVEVAQRIFEIAAARIGQAARDITRSLIWF